MHVIKKITMISFNLKLPYPIMSLRCFCTEDLIQKYLFQRNTVFRDKSINELLSHTEEKNKYK